jgi:hypothetical protein
VEWILIFVKSQNREIMGFVMDKMIDIFSFAELSINECHIFVVIAALNYCQVPGVLALDVQLLL